MRIPIVLLAVFASYVPSMVSPSLARACSPPEAPFITDYQPIHGIPTRGVVPIRYSDPRGEGFRIQSAVVRDSAGAEIPGTVTQLHERIVWSADAPLAPSTTYTITIEVFGDPSVIDFITADNDDDIPLATALEDVALIEAHQPLSRACCSSGSDSSCGPSPLCFNLAYHRTVNMTATLGGSPLSQRFQAVSLFASGSQVDGDQLFGGFANDQPEYCLRVGVRSLLSGSHQMVEVCRPAADVTPVSEPEADSIDESRCEGPVIDAQTGEEIGGCSASGASGGSGAALLLLLLARCRRGARRERDPVGAAQSAERKATRSERCSSVKTKPRNVS